MKQNIVKSKSFEFAIEVVNLYKSLVEKKKEFVLSNQLLRSGTSVGAMIREAEFAENKADFIHKFSIAQKEINESIYWIELLYETNYISKIEFSENNIKAVELIKLITSILKSAKQNIKN